MDFTTGSVFGEQVKIKKALNAGRDIHGQPRKVAGNVEKARKAVSKAYHESLKKIENEFPNSIILDKALFNIATLYENQLQEIELAKSYYKKILFEHPSSLYVVDSRKRFRKLSGKTNQNIIKDS